MVMKLTYVHYKNHISITDFHVFWDYHTVKWLQPVNFSFVFIGTKRSYLCYSECGITQCNVFFRLLHKRIVLTFFPCGGPGLKSYLFFWMGSWSIQVRTDGLSFNIRGINISAADPYSQNQEINMQNWGKTDRVTPTSDL